MLLRLSLSGILLLSAASFLPAEEPKKGDALGTGVTGTIESGLKEANTFSEAGKIKASWLPRWLGNAKSRGRLASRIKHCKKMMNKFLTGPGGKVLGHSVVAANYAEALGYAVGGDMGAAGVSVLNATAQGLTAAGGATLGAKMFGSVGFAVGGPVGTVVGGAVGGVVGFVVCAIGYDVYVKGAVEEGLAPSAPDHFELTRAQKAHVDAFDVEVTMLAREGYGDGDAPEVHLRSTASVGFLPPVEGTAVTDAMKVPQDGTVTIRLGSNYPPEVYRISQGVVTGTTRVRKEWTPEQSIIEDVHLFKGKLTDNRISGRWSRQTVYLSKDGRTKIDKRSQETREITLNPNGSVEMTSTNKGVSTVFRKEPNEGAWKQKVNSEFGPFHQKLNASWSVGASR